MTRFYSTLFAIVSLIGRVQTAFASVPVGPSQGAYVGITPSDAAFQCGDFVGYESAKLGITPAVFVQFFDLPLGDGGVNSLNDFFTQVQLPFPVFTAGSLSPL